MEIQDWPKKNLSSPLKVALPFKYPCPAPKRAAPKLVVPRDLPLQFPADHVRVVGVEIACFVIDDKKRFI